ncbi:hypothetical protein [Mucilaginibacter sp. UR6-11]|uniref:hypothetical protein n=1 Tax=Mucilaginibacter sp. UR6-11 TaxID=1435644 RepID=UPI001E48BF4B|nr:hypothetical protein [Mucilaginibacter sp. UR6-11]MCC8424963.1 hypothetical protein [Mucilaginibacter sp. UR6-11]
MTLSELKNSLHKKIDDLNDPAYLEMLGSMIDQREEVFIIPEHMLEGIKQGKEDIKNGDFITLEELEKKYEKWLKE